MQRLLEIRDVSSADLDRLADQIASYLLDGANPFYLALKGELGAGKTTLVSKVLRSLGLPATESVSSPTYTICSEYEADGQWFAHLDLYRMPQGADIWEQLGIGESRPFRGFFVEWPERDASFGNQITHTLAISFGDAPETRNYQFIKN